MPLLTLNLSCENVKYPARKHFEKTNTIKTVDQQDAIEFNANELKISIFPLSNLVCHLYLWDPTKKLISPALSDSLLLGGILLGCMF